jgi:type II secretory pathway component PulC
MRRTLLAFVVAALPMSAMAQDAAPAAAAAAPTARPTRLVGVILSSAQALLWDDERGEYVLHRVGDDAFGGRLVELDADHVVIERGEVREVMELTAPPQMRVAGKRAPKRLPAMVISAAPERDVVAAVAVAAPAPVAAAPAVAPAPVAAAPVVVPAPVAAAPAAPAPVAAAPAPVAAPAPAFVAAAPSSDIAIAPAPAAPAAAPAVAAPAAVAPVAVTPPAPVVAAPLPSPPAAAPVASPVATPTVVTPVTPTAPATPAVAATVTPARQRVTAMVVPRADLDRALGDFAALSQDVQVAQQPQGGFRLSAVRAGSFFERIGLRANDVVLRVDGRPINGIEDASAAYAWLRVTNRFNVELVRDGRPVTLRYVISQPMTASAQ